MERWIFFFNLYWTIYYKLHFFRESMSEVKLEGRKLTGPAAAKNKNYDISSALNYGGFKDE